MVVERVRCRTYSQELLRAFSRKGRGLCSSCGAKRAAELAALLVDEVVEDVGHAQWVFAVPKMLRLCFLYHRELLGELSRAPDRRLRRPPQLIAPPTAVHCFTRGDTGVGR